MPRSYKPIQLIWNYTPVLKPMPAADLPAAVDEEPAVCLRLSNKLVPYLLGLLEMYRWEDKLTGTPQEVIDGLGLFQDLLIALTEGNCTGDSMPFQLRQNPLNSCQLQQSLDGGQTWTLAYDYSKCIKPAQTLNQTTVTFTEQARQLANVYSTNPPLTIKTDGTSAGTVAREQGICAGVLVAAASFIVLIEESIESTNDDWWSGLSNGLGIVAGIAAIAGIVVGGGALVLGLGLAKIVLGAAAFEGIALLFDSGSTLAEANELADLGSNLTEDERNNFVCCLSSALKADFTYDTFRNFSCAGVRPEVLGAWREVVTPEVWAGLVIAVDDASTANADSLCCGENCQYIAPASAISIGTNTTRLGAILIDNDNNPPTGSAIDKKIYAVYELPEPRVVTSVNIDAYILPYAQIGNLTIDLLLPDQNLAIGGSSVSVISGNQSYLLTVNNPGGLPITKFAISIEVARAASNQVTSWNNASGELRAIKYCYSI